MTAPCEVLLRVTGRTRCGRPYECRQCPIARRERLQDLPWVCGACVDEFLAPLGIYDEGRCSICGAESGVLQPVSGILERIAAYRCGLGPIGSAYGTITERWAVVVGGETATAFVVIRDDDAVILCLHRGLWDAGTDVVDGDFGPWAVARFPAGAAIEAIKRALG